MEMNNFYTYKLSMPSQKALFNKSETIRLANLINQKQNKSNKARMGFVGTVVNRLLPSHLLQH